MAKLHYKDSPTPTQRSSFAKYLAEDEELILVTGLGKTYIRSKFIMYLIFPGIIFGAAGFGIATLFNAEKMPALILAIVFALIIAFLKTLHIYHANRYLLTTRRVLIKKGFFNVRLTVALYDKITNLEVDQGVIDRLLLHHGTIVVNTAGLNKNEMILKYVDYPMEFKNLMERLINREREQSGRGGTISTVEGEIIS